MRSWTLSSAAQTLEGTPAAAAPSGPPQINVDGTTTETGLQIFDIEVGDGAEVQPGVFVTIHYTGRLEDGTEFDTSVGGDPLRISLNGAIPGWNEGIPGMKVGGKRELIIPPSLGYGRLGGLGGAVPPNATITYDVELLDVEPPPTPTPGP